MRSIHPPSLQAAQQENPDMNENQQLIANAFAAWEAGDAQAVFKLMSPELEWRIIGSTDISGTYRSKKEFLDMVNARLMPHMSGPLQPSVTRIFASGTTVVVQFTSFAPTRSGPDYEQTYCWIMEVEAGEIRSGTAYLDTALIDRVLA